MKTKLMILAFLAAGSLLAQPRFYAGVRFGYAPAPVAIAVAPPAPVVSYVPAPRVGYSWVAGYWYPVGHHYYWRAGYWARPAFYGAHWEAPHYYRSHYYYGHWRR